MYDKAFAHLHKAAELQPYSGTYFNIGRTYEKITNNQKAIEYYAIALNADTYQPKENKPLLSSYRRLARLLLHTEKYGDAKVVLDKGIKEYPDDGILWIERAVCEYNLHNYPFSLSAAEKAKMILPNQLTKTIYSQLQNKKDLDVTLSF